MKDDEKKRRKAILQNLKNKERTQFADSLPASEFEIKALFNYLDKTLEDCDDTLHQTICFIRERNMPEEKVISWLNEHGGFCDCEVLANVEDEYNQMIS